MWMGQEMVLENGTTHIGWFLRIEWGQNVTAMITHGCVGDIDFPQFWQERRKITRYHQISCYMVSVNRLTYLNITRYHYIVISSRLWLLWHFVGHRSTCHVWMPKHCFRFQAKHLTRANTDSMLIDCWRWDYTWKEIWIRCVSINIINYLQLTIND